VVPRASLFLNFDSEKLEMSIKKIPSKKTIQGNATVRMGSDKGPASLGTNTKRPPLRATDASDHCRNLRAPDANHHKGEGTCR